MKQKTFQVFSAQVDRCIAQALLIAALLLAPWSAHALAPAPKQGDTLKELIDVIE